MRMRARPKIILETSFEAALARFERYQDHVLGLADRHDVPIVDNIHFDRSVLAIIRHVAETLRKRGGFEVDELL